LIRNSLTSNLSSKYHFADAVILYFFVQAGASHLLAIVVNGLPSPPLAWFLSNLSMTAPMPI
jgi:hypothetical protein